MAHHTDVKKMQKQNQTQNENMFQRVIRKAPGLIAQQLSPSSAVARSVADELRKGEMSQRNVAVNAAPRKRIDRKLVKRYESAFGKNRVTKK